MDSTVLLNNSFYPFRRWLPIFLIIERLSLLLHSYVFMYLLIWLCIMYIMFQHLSIQLGGRQDALKLVVESH